MPIVAIAGGTSPTLGRSIVQAIQSTSNTNTPIILTRQSPSAPKTKWNAAVRQVSYTNHFSLVAALQGVHTLICVLKIPGPEWAECQLNLLRAAEQAGVKRFAPSEFGLGPAAADGRVDVLSVKAKVWEACLDSELEVGRFACGGFMNYLSIGRDFGGDGERELEALAGFQEEAPLVWDVANGKVEEPTKADGSSPLISLTDIWDVGKLVAGACELEAGEWEEEMEMVGETISIAEVTGLIEKYSGRKLNVTKVRRDELMRRAETIDGFARNRDEVVTKMYAQMGMLILDQEHGGAVMEPTVNRLCPWVKAKSVEHYLAACWRE